MIKHATLADAEWVGSNLRAEDEREVRTASGEPGATVVPRSFVLSRECFAIWPKDAENPAALIGVCDDPQSPRMGIVWLLATDEVKRCRFFIRKIAPAVADYFTRYYPLGLHNIADERNVLHLRWCKSSGFNLGPQRVILRGHSFIYIHRPPSKTCVIQ